MQFLSRYLDKNVYQTSVENIFIQGFFDVSKSKPDLAMNAPFWSLKEKNIIQENNYLCSCQLFISDRK